MLTLPVVLLLPTRMNQWVSITRVGWWSFEQALLTALYLPHHSHSSWNTFQRHLLSWDAGCPTQPYPTIWKSVSSAHQAGGCPFLPGMATHSWFTPPPHAFLLVGKWAGWCCYEDLTGNFVVRTEWFSSVEKDKAFVWGWSKTILLPSYLSLDFTFALLYLKRFQKHLNVKLMTKSEAKC